MAQNNFKHVVGQNAVVLMEVAGADGSYTGSYKPVAGAKNHNLSFGGEIVEVFSKSHSAKAVDYGLPEWNGSIDALVSFDANACNLKSFLQAKKDKKKIKIVSAVANPGSAPLDDETSIATADIDSDTFVSGSFYIIGEAVIESIEVTSPEGSETVTFSMSFKGSEDYRNRFTFSF